MLEKNYKIYKKKQGLRIRLARRIANLSQAELADKMTAELGFEFGDDVKVSRIERGIQDVSGRELVALAAILDQPAGWLQGVEDEGMRAPIIHELSRQWFPRPIDIQVKAPVRLAA